MAGNRIQGVENQKVKLFNTDCVEALKELPENSVDAIVTDPPYFIGFMGKKWDAEKHIASHPDFWAECLRVLKPGGHCLAFGHSRTHHRLFTAIEDAGFVIKDTIMWMYGSGFPKSHNIGKSVQKKDNNNKQWEGWGTALKPAYEPICLAQKPKEGTYADNVLNYGVGGLNIDECRIGTNEDFSNVKPRTMMTNQGSVAKTKREGGTHNHNDAASLKEAKDKLQNLGRFPANVILDNEVGDLLDEQSGTTKGTRSIRRNKSGMGIHDSPKGTFGKGDVLGGYDDEGGASRFFYQAKSSKKDRNKYCEGLEEKKFVLNESIRDNDRLEGGVEGDLGWNKQKIRRNHHPTVKPIKLMDYLIRLITPAGGTVLDPFMGSGSTGIAAIEGGWDFIGCEKEKEYFEIATTRLQNCDEQKKDK